MPSFRLSLNPKHLAIAKYLKSAERELKFEVKNHEIIVEFEYGFTVFKVEVASLIPDFTDADWSNLISEIKRTVTGAKVREFSSMSFGVRPTRVHDIHVRLDATEKHLLEEAAVLDGKSLSEFIRSTALKAASEILNRKTRQVETDLSTDEKHAYVS
jgi:uncharacterized protein (DUF1778 family)